MKSHFIDKMKDSSVSTDEKVEFDNWQIGNYVKYRDAMRCMKFRDLENDSMIMGKAGLSLGEYVFVTKYCEELKKAAIVRGLLFCKADAKEWIKSRQHEILDATFGIEDRLDMIKDCEKALMKINELDTDKVRICVKESGFIDVDKEEE